MTITILILGSSTTPYAMDGSAASSKTSSWTIPALFASVGVIGAGYGAWWYSKNVSPKVERFEAKKEILGDLEHCLMEPLHMVNRRVPSKRHRYTFKDTSSRASLLKQLIAVDPDLVDSVEVTEPIEKLIQKIEASKNNNERQDSLWPQVTAQCGTIEEKVAQPMVEAQRYFRNRVIESVVAFCGALYLYNKLFGK